MPDDVDVVDWSPGRFWTYDKTSWTPKWPYRWGLPMFGQTDEWGRRTVVWGTKFTGYLVYAWSTCWCEQCHEAREQTYEQKRLWEAGDRERP